MSSSRPTRSFKEHQPLLAPKGRRRLGPPKNPLPLLKTTSTVKLVYANFQFTKSEDADSYVNGKMLDLLSSSLNSMINAPDVRKKFFENHGWNSEKAILPSSISFFAYGVIIPNTPFPLYAPQFESLEASFGDIKEEQKKLGQQLEKLSLDMKTGFDDIKQLFAAHDERFNLLERM
ncbi:hypothetical protein CJ030_MR5G020722 [Morella rubra]|uniref:Uncharacterized protein n=1 Tax=Morella rubra TaxID=262757 RepID=A0A6A1VHX8_9ROSI|nr:hypothetical protein CJ030_MR5G020722 [Morella rubra]